MSNGKDIRGKVLYLGAFEPKVSATIKVLTREHGGVYAATLFDPIKKGEGEEAILKTLGLNDRHRFSSQEQLEEALRKYWGFEPVESQE